MELGRSKSFLPAFSRALGLGAQWAGGHLGSGLASHRMKAPFCGVILLGGSSETIQGL